jgi:hypothetical protein
MCLSKRILRCVVLCCCALATVRGEDPSAPMIRSFAGAFLGSHAHDFFVESELRLPIVQVAPFGLYYDYRESTPFLRELGGVHAEVLYRRQWLEGNFKLNDQLRLIAVGGYLSSYAVDTPGLMSAYALGGGIGSPAASDGGPLIWHVLAGGYASRRDLQADWWTDVYASWRMMEFARDRYLDSDFTASLRLIADVESVNDGADFNAFYKIGIALQLLTANANRCAVQLLWYHNDSNPFFGEQENGFLLGLDVNSSLASNYTFQARRERQRGLFPLIWGAYDVGAATSRRISRFEMNAELIDVEIAQHPFTGIVWYESRQEYRNGDFENIAYSVTLGIQTPIGLESIASHGDPLIAGFDFLHRSDHALNPDADRVAPGQLLDNGSHNLLPRLRLQTLGWDLPYRDPALYERRTEWLNIFDWRVTAGIDVNDDRKRGKFASQLGLNWDMATLEGYVVYLHGLISTGNETPDWLGEFGVRRPVGKLFTRYESYGIKSDIARGNTWVIGLGVNL